MGSSAPTAPIRLAVLLADTPAPGIAAKYESYYGVFKYLFERACASLEPPQTLESQLTITKHDVVNDLSSYPDPESVDAILITGSKHSAYENDPWIVKLVEYTRQVYEAGRVRVIGVCFGHQIVGRALGAPVGLNDKGWELSVIEHEMTEEGKKFFGFDKLRLHHMHRDIVRSFPPGAVALAHTEICPVQAFWVPGRAICVQGHPEFTEEMVREILTMRKYGGILPDDIFEDGLKRVANEHDGVSVAKVFLKFLKE